MCGIYAQIGSNARKTQKEILNNLLDALKKLETRSYDSVGVSFPVQNTENQGLVWTLKFEF